MIRKLLKLFILTTVIIMLVITVVLLVYIYQRDKAKISGESLTERLALRPKARGILQQKTEKPSEEAVVKTVLFLRDEEEADLIRRAYLVLFDKKRASLRFFSIPKDAVFEISPELYADLSTGIAGIPQISRLSHFYSYAKNETGLKAAMYILNDAIGLDIGHYILIPKEEVSEIFDFSVAEGRIQADFMKRMATGELAGTYLKEKFKKKNTDIAKEELKRLLKELAAVKEEDIHFKELPFVKKNVGSLIEKEEAIRLIYSHDEE